jgi:hypothetical protein
MPQPFSCVLKLLNSHMPLTKLLGSVRYVCHASIALS